jgi:hypothetical protein
LARDNNKRKRSFDRDNARQMIRALIVLAVAIAVFILSGNEKVMSRFKKLAGMETAVIVCADK